jgi:Fur family peroxide stress response transcriptional regulator
MATTTDHHEHLYDDAMTRSGIRLTPQRRTVYEAIMEQRDHPTATEVYLRAKDRIPSISLATVYNCLDALTESGLIRHVNVDRESSRYCPNLAPHGHFFCSDCGAVFDVPIKSELTAACQLPEQTLVSQTEITLRGLCPACATKATAAR